jgi:hypothetical protein
MRGAPVPGDLLQRYYPVIYVRGFAVTQSEIEAVVADLSRW